MRPFSLVRLFWIAILAATLLLGLSRLMVETIWLQHLLEVLLASIGTLVAVVLLARGLKVFLWRVGRRLAFSYFLIGVLPIPMVLVLGGIGLYMLSGYFLSHEYRTALATVHADLDSAAASSLERFSARGVSSSVGDAGIELAYYSDGRRVAGTDVAPNTWPAWVDEMEAESDANGQARYWSLDDGALAIVATATNGRQSVLALRRGRIDRELAAHSGFWVTLRDPAADATPDTVRLQLGQGEYNLGDPGAGTDESARDAFFGIEGEDQPWLDRPFLWWVEVAGAVYSLSDGSEHIEYLRASINGTPRRVRDEFFSASADLNAMVWASLIAVIGLLSSIYLIAVLMAFYMIFTLSRAVNRLSRVTDAVRSGDFSRRIPVRRHDQIGELQLSFNDMTGSLETLIETAAQKELLEKELEIARDLQESLLPAEVPATEQVEFSTLFEPSAAIGGDYFDILRIDDDRIAVVIADVSGHGLPTGLRMAMLKAALVILVQERKPPSEILKRLNRMVRAEKRQRFFVTATISVIDFRNNTLEITNAGHPPTYLIRNGEVEEILLAGSPLGALDENYRQQTVPLEPGDVAVWLSDGLIEANDRTDAPFGYEATEQALAGPSRSAVQVRDRLLAAVEAHTRGVPAEDDRTLVAMRYFPGSDSTSIPSSE